MNVILFGATGMIGQGVLRECLIQPMHGIKSRTGWYNALYGLLWPLYPVLSRVAPRYVLTTEQIGRAMLHVVRHGAPRRVLESRDVRSLLNV